MTVLASIVTVVGTAMALSNFSQAYKIFKRRCAKDISGITWITYSIGALFWFLYGLEIGNAPIIIANSVGTLSCWTVLAYWIMYK